MSELSAGFLSAAPLSEAMPDSPDTASHPSAGHLLKQARETAGLHIAALAVALKVSVKKLEALEADRFDLLPDAVFVRALAASVCRTLKVDAAPVLQRLPQASNQKLGYMGAGINTPFRAPGDGPGPTIWTHVSKPAVLAGLALLLAALVLVLLPVIKTGISDLRSTARGAEGAGSSANTGSAAGAPGAGDANATRPVLLARDLFPPDPDASGLASAVLTGASPSLPLLAASPRPTDPASVSTVMLEIPAPAQASIVSTPTNLPAAAGIVVFSAQGESWVEVTDAKGLVVLRRILAAGETASASGALPLVAVVGRANVTQVQVRGKAFDLAAVSRDNIARFEVK